MDPRSPVPEVIIVDWGTSSFRAWLVRPVDAAVLAEIPAGIGMRDLPPRSFADYCSERLQPWLVRTPRPPVFLAGMVGAPTGWAPAPQVAVPQDAQSLAGYLMAAPGMEGAWILPGVKVDSLSPDRVDVMRGEEVQILGALTLTGRQDAVVCLPGTHSKWARVAEGCLVDFTTFMTGEFHGVLMAHSLLGQGCPPSPQAGGAEASKGPSAFEQGLQQSATHEGGLLSHAFAARTRRLLRGLPVDDVADFLSGVVIGEELKGAAALGILPCPEVILVGADALVARYQVALRALGYAVVHVNAREATLNGVLSVVEEAALSLSLC